MRDKNDLRRILSRIDGRGYPAYKDIRGEYDFGEFVLHIDHVQGDPFAAPSRFRVTIDKSVAGFPAWADSSRSRRIAFGDFLARAFGSAVDEVAKGRRGSGKSGLIEIDRPRQQVLDRTAAIAYDKEIEARFLVGLPAAGRRVLAREAETMLFHEIPSIVDRALTARHADLARLKDHVECAEDQDSLRDRLNDLGLVAFVANGSVLPRRSGVDDRPMSNGHVVEFKSPPSLEVSVELPNCGTITGMGVPQGITLVVGGGFHGKSTLLNALSLGVYNHVPGDGRDLVASVSGTVKIRAEDGRRIEKVDISPFLSNLPFGRDTHAFSTDDASGSTSQAANIMETLELGATCLLMDEDTCATNFMIRDHRMQELVAKDKEPITCFLDKANYLYRELGVSVVLVVGGSGDYFDIADLVIAMEEYVPKDVTAEAQRIVGKYQAERAAEGGETFGRVTNRKPVASSIDPSRGRRDVKIDVKGMRTILFGRQTIDLSAIEQLVSSSQTRAIGDAILYARERYMDGSLTLRSILDRVEADFKTEGLDVLSRRKLGSYAAARRFEIGAAINRLRTLRVK